MRTVGSILTSIIACLLLSLDICIAGEAIITPFSPFAWEDDLLTAVVKANSIPGVETVVLTFGNSNANQKPINLMGITTSTQLGDKLSDMFKDLPPYLADLNNPRTKSAPFVSTYLDPKGHEQQYFGWSQNINVSPVVIANVPFTLIIKLAPHPGFAILHPSKVIKDSRVGYSFMAVMAQVNLYSNSPVLPDNIEKIENSVENKYRQFDHGGAMRFFFTSGEPSYLYGKVNDGKGHSFELKNDMANFGGVLIQYAQNNSEELVEAYRKHLADLEAKKYQGKTDMKPGL